MTNLDFFKASLANEKDATLNMIKSLPTEKLDYKPHPINRTAREIVSHLLAHMVDMKKILNSTVCDETMDVDFSDSGDAASKMEQLWHELCQQVNFLLKESWESESVSLLIESKPYISLQRNSMMWFFFLDIIHHRGQLSSYVRPMGGKNPAVYGFSADTK
ncbi:MAG: DinB family protein [Bacteroidota bacterium]